MTENSDTYPDGATVAAYDIARLAGVGRAAVSNWRRRYPDFPKPVGGTAASPLYALTDVEQWLARHGRSFQLSPGDRLWQRVRGAVDDLQLGDLLGAVGGFLVYLRRQPRRWRTLARRTDDEVAATLATAVPKVVPELPAAAGAQLPPEWVPIARQAAEAVGEQDHREVFDLLCGRFLEVHSRRRLVTAPAIANLMADLADAGRGTVLDPACGIGTLLLAGWERGATELLGQDMDTGAARLTAVRLLLREAPTRVHDGDSLRTDAFDGELADTVLCDPPFSERSWGYEELAGDLRWEFGLPPRGEPELAWLQHCLSHVKPGRFAAVVMPAGSASRRAGRRIRGNLLRSGALRAVVNLPEGGPGAAAPPAVWVLCRPTPGDPSPSHLLMADAAPAVAAASAANSGDDTGTGDGGGSAADGGTGPDGAADPAVVVKAWRTFLSDPEAELPGPSRAVRIIDLLDDEVDLTPLRHLTRAAAGQGTGFGPARAGLRDALDQLAATVPELTEAPEPAQPSEVTVGELVRAGVLTIHQAPLKMTVDAGRAPVLTARDLRSHRGPSGRTTLEPGTVTLEPGDVVTPVSAREPTVLVVDDTGALAGAALGPQLYLLRPDLERVDPEFLAGFLRIAQDQSVSRSGTLSVRSDVHRLTLPRLPVAEQRRYGEAFRQLAAFDAQLRQTRNLARELIQEGLAGLASGRLRVADG